MNSNINNMIANAVEYKLNQLTQYDENEKRNQAVYIRTAVEVTIELLKELNYIPKD